MSKHRKHPENQVSIQTEGQSGGVNIGGSVNAVGDIIAGNKYGDTIITKKTGDGAVVTAERGATTTVGSLAEELAQWQAQMESEIDSHATLPAKKKRDLKKQIAGIRAEASKGNKGNLGWLEERINNLALMSEDIFEVAVSTLANPLLGIGLVLKKIRNKAKLSIAESHPAVDN